MNESYDKILSSVNERRKKLMTDDEMKKEILKVWDKYLEEEFPELEEMDEDFEDWVW
jgi:hypothetical protein